MNGPNDSTAFYCYTSTLDNIVPNKQTNTLDFLALNRNFIRHSRLPKNQHILNCTRREKSFCPKRNLLYLLWTLKTNAYFPKDTYFFHKNAQCYQYYAQSNKFAKKIWKNMCTSLVGCFTPLVFIYIGIYFSAQFLTWFHRR